MKRLPENEGAFLTTIQGLTGNTSDIRTAVDTPQSIEALPAGMPSGDLDLKHMAQWAMNYLIRTPRKEYNYEPVFQCHPLRCPPVPDRRDVVVPCDTDARMSWEWYYMRDISGSTAGRDIEAVFMARMLAYIDDDGVVWAPPGCYNEGSIDAVYDKKDYVIHVWGATKILRMLSEDYGRTYNKQSRSLARKVMLALKSLATYDGSGRCWFAGGMGALRADRSVVPNGWNSHPAPVVGPLVTYWQVTSDADALAFAKAYADGIIAGVQPGGIQFNADGRFRGHSHATMHSLWGVAELGIATGEPHYVEFAKRSWDWMLTRGTGTGWFPAMPDNCNETCCVSDMMSIAALVGRGGHPEYFDCVERYLRNHISNQQFIVTPQFEAYYRELNKDAGEDAIRKGIDALRAFQGGIIGGSGLNDWENALLGGVSGFEMFGCCAPEGMRAIYTAWTNTIARYPASPLGPEGVYVNMSVSRESQWARVVSFMPDEGRLTVVASVNDAFFLRPPHWSPRNAVHAFANGKSVPVAWSGSYVRFKAKPGDELTITYPLIRFTHECEGIWKQSAPNLKMTFHWLGNMVLETDPAPIRTPLFTGKPRVLPPAPF